MCSCVEVINDTCTVRARKEHIDNCKEFVMEVLPEIRRNEFGRLSFSELRLIAESIRDNWKIKKGDLHDVQVCKMDGEIYSFRSKIGMAKICHKYELFPEC